MCVCGGWGGGGGVGWGGLGKVTREFFFILLLWYSSLGTGIQEMSDQDLHCKACLSQNLGLIQYYMV